MRAPRKYVLTPGSRFHKIWRCHDRQYLLQDHGEKHAYLNAIHNDYINRCSRDDFAIYCYNLMSNHCHEGSEVFKEVVPYSNHMRRAHGIFGLKFNMRNNRIGKVAHGRPKTLRVENDEELKNLMFYIDCNPVRAGITKHPTDIRWKDFSSCRFYCFGERNSYSDMLTLPEWYMRLGKTARQRQRKYRSMLDRYLVKSGMKRDPSKTRGYFIGGQLWIEEMRTELAAKIKKSNSPSGTDPPT